MDERGDRIIAVAMELAERDGYDAVKLRDVAAQAGVALGTVYRRFSCKEDILAAALDRQVTVAYDLVRANPLPGDTPQERLDALFELSTKTLADRPRLAAAMLRTVASGVPELAERVTRYHDRMTALLLEVMQPGRDDSPPSPRERMLVELLQNVWFASLVGWTGGLFGPDHVTQNTKVATRLLLRGLEAPWDDSLFPSPPDGSASDSQPS